MGTVAHASNRSELAAAMREALNREARRNEMRVAVVRILAYGLVLVLDIALWSRGLRPASHIAGGATWVLLSGVLLLAIKRLPYGRVYWFIVPVVDFFLIDGILGTRIAALGVTTAMAAVTALACGLFAATGGIRFDRRAAAWTTFLAVVLLVRLLGDHASRVHLLYSGVAIIAIGMLNVWLADQVRRAMEATRGQLLLDRLLPTVGRAALKDPLSLLDAPRSVEATLLVTDLRGFTSLSERMEPSDVFELLNQLQGALSEAVHACGGIVDKFMGDGMLAVFGATEPGHDHARRAIEAVRRIRAALDEQNRARAAGLRIGIGVHSGTVVAGCLGGGSRLEFTVIGDAVNTTSRLEAMTKEMGVDVLVSEETAARVPEVTFEDLGVVPVRGRQQGIRIFTLKS
ncbi:adenylate/guanylate cyclase domain-containing protein [Polyangium sp. y55x31]|uniref:adenylate/guanylate cyclase domain-containing protein n=1 Tax=Polyangium sp. y55x31 TaxID=3042688 RepID=UPI0024826B09|nr:adenylate/guanylate cyclase domain-containing protein [Polyangium sp. y55x31]MDI1479524.1 adenylate/guanylate cyclase domain-containing protein [Polyangium sp. y55x31]